MGTEWHREETVVGLVVNLAARLQEQAEAGIGKSRRVAFVAGGGAYPREDA